MLIMQHMLSHWIMYINRLIKQKQWKILFLLLLFTSCKKDPVTFSPNASEYTFVRPSHFPEPAYSFENNEISKEGFLLGRKLFYDPILSLDNSISCNNCHIQGVGFADSQQHPFSIGVDNEIGMRNALPLMNLAFYQEYFWDGGVTHLDFVPVNAIESPVEMKETMANAVLKLNQSEAYKSLFKQAYGIDEITSPYLLQSLSDFMNRMVSANSKYDQGYFTGFGNFTADEKAGKLLFEANCTSCHNGVLFTDQSYRNNGISTTFLDEGRARITENNADIGKFRVPTLRNIEKTAPYMHNASFKTLEEVLEHYASGVQKSVTLDASLIKEDSTYGINLSKEEQALIITFLKTLTDESFLQNALFVEYN